MKLLDLVLSIRDILDWLPGVVLLGVPFPLDQILKLSSM